MIKTTVNVFIHRFLKHSNRMAFRRSRSHIDDVNKYKCKVKRRSRDLQQGDLCA